MLAFIFFLFSAAKYKLDLARSHSLSSSPSLSLAQLVSQNMKLTRRHKLFKVVLGEEGRRWEANVDIFPPLYKSQPQFASNRVKRPWD